MMQASQMNFAFYLCVVVVVHCVCKMKIRKAMRGIICEYSIVRLLRYLNPEKLVTGSKKTHFCDNT